MTSISPMHMLQNLSCASSVSESSPFSDNQKLSAFASAEEIMRSLLPNELIKKTIAELEQNLTFREKANWHIQQKEFDNGTIPKISDYCVQCAAIEENNEPFIDVFKESNPRITSIPLDVLEFFGGIPTDVAGCMRKSNYDKLQQMVEMLPSDIIVWLSEAYRDPIQQMQDWLLNMATYLQSNPGSTFETAIGEVNKMVSPIMNKQWWKIMSEELARQDIDLQEQLEGLADVMNAKELPSNLTQAFRAAIPTVNELYQQDPDPVLPLVVPPHTTGGAMDIFFAIKLNDHQTVMLWEGKPGAMKGANPTSLTFEQEGLDDREKLIRKMIYLAALNAGLVNYGNEFWHYESGTRLHSFYTSDNHKPASYGLLNRGQMKNLLNA